MPRTAYTVHCHYCARPFPIVVSTDPENTAADAPRSKELECPFCEKLLTVKFDQPLANDTFVLKSFPRNA